MSKQPRDYYDVLGISRTASTDDIRSAYRKLARKYHPDVNKSPDAAKLFAEVQEAYDVLSDAEKRKAYDRFGHAGVGAGSPGGGAGPAGWGGFGGPGGRGGTVWTTGSHSGMGPDDLSDIFEELFGQGHRRSAASSPFDFGAAGPGRAAPGGPSRTAQRGPDVEHTMTTSFMTAALGGSEQLRFTVDGNSSTISVKIPPGTDHGAKLRIKGRGQPAPMGGTPGDLILTIEVGNHPHFRREGLDLLIDVPITIAEAVLGTTVEVPLLGNDASGAGTVKIKVPPGASSGQKLRVRGKGLRDAKGKIGDYYAVTQITAPKPSELSENSMKIVSELARELKNPRESAPYVDH